MTANAAFVAVDPAQTHLLHVACFGLGADIDRIARAVRLAEGVTTRDQCHGFVVFHAHAAERVAHVKARCDRVGIAVRPFGVHIDQTHLHRGQRVVQQAVLAVARAFLVGCRQPFGFRTPVDVFLGLVNVHATAAKAEHLAAHRFDGAVARKDHQVGPGQGVAVFLLDRPQQAARLVQVAVVGPRVQRREPLVTGRGTATAIGRTVGACAVPCHADEQRAIMAIVRRPPRLAVGHQRENVLFDRVQIKRAKGSGVIKLFAQRVHQRRMLAQHFQVQRIGPPITVGHLFLAVEGAFHFAVHGAVSDLFRNIALCDPTRQACGPF